MNGKKAKALRKTAQNTWPEDRFAYKTVKKLYNATQRNKRAEIKGRPVWLGKETI